MMKISLIKATDTCSHCGADCAPSPDHWAGPLCTACKHKDRAEDYFLALDTPHDLYFALQPFVSDLTPFSNDADPADLPEAQGLWRF